MFREVVLPSLGGDDDAVKGGRISMLLAQAGAHVNQEDDLVEILTDKAAFVVPSPVSGVLRAWKVEVGDLVQVGETLCEFDTDV